MYGQQYNNYGYGYQPQQFGMPYFAPQPFLQQNIQTPMNQNALTNEEIQKLMSMRPTGLLNLQIDQNDVLRAICTHKNNGHDVVQQIQDGSGDVYCPICGERWSAENVSKEDLVESVKNLISQMQNAKWVGELPVNIVREYFTMIPLLKKFPDLFEYGSENMKRLLNQRGFNMAGDASIYAQYNGLFGPGMGYGATQQYYGVPQPGGYYQQPVQSPMMNQAQPQMPMQPAMPGVNPMQVQYGAPQPQYGIPGSPGPQYYQQPGIGGQAPMNPYGMPQQPQMPQVQPQPVYGQPVVNQPQPQSQQPSGNNSNGLPSQAKIIRPGNTETKTIDL